MKKYVFLFAGIVSFLAGFLFARKYTVTIDIHKDA